MPHMNMQVEYGGTIKHTTLLDSDTVYAVFSHCLEKVAFVLHVTEQDVYKESFKNSICCKHVLFTLLMCMNRNRIINPKHPNSEVASIHSLAQVPTLVTTFTFVGLRDTQSTSFMPQMVSTMPICKVPEAATNVYHTLNKQPIIWVIKQGLLIAYVSNSSQEVLPPFHILICVLHPSNATENYFVKPQ